MIRKITIKGYVLVHETNGEDDDDYSAGENVVFFSDVPDVPLLRRFEEAKLNNAQVSVRYWSATNEASLDKIQLEFARTLRGFADIDFGARYSEATGFLWFDNAMKVGGHDLERELSSQAGRYVVLEIDVEKEARK